jgi:CBS domain-containing protein
VVDDDGTVLGVISSLDLVRAVQQEYDDAIPPSVPAYFRDDRTALADELKDRLGELTAIDAAVPEVVSVTPDTPISEVARILREQRIHRVLVLEEGILLGILTTFDLLGLIEDGDRRDELEIARRVH